MLPKIHELDELVLDVILKIFTTYPSRSTYMYDTLPCRGSAETADMHEKQKNVFKKSNHRPSTSNCFVISSMYRYTYHGI